MEPERWQNVERIYLAALQFEGSERKSFVERNCGADAALQAEVESLLKYAERPARFFDSPAFEVVARALADDLRAEDNSQSSRMTDARIAQYRIVGKLGAGGMGDVYRAVRADDQYEKQVAIKLVRQGLDSESVYNRFRQERQILAGFEHENIARLIDGGSTEEGHPYFVMELVEGQPIDGYCDERKLGVVARLGLFQKVCSAVQYAHQRLVVHRDIKPSNILVTADGIPKLLDFGIATILSADADSQRADPTVTALRVMTPQFASPEQLRGGVITTATDIYSLGVVLYRLLSGHLPYRTASNSPYDLSHAICEVEPAKPSTAVGQFGQVLDSSFTDAKRETLKVTPESVSGNRNTSPEKLRKTLSGDLDQILLKALRKEPQRRYASAQDFSEDLRSYALGLPVSARRVTVGYRGGKFIRRHKLSVAATAAVALFMVAGAVAIVREARIARMQEARADRRFNDVRKLANSQLFDIYDKIQNLPGSTTARKALVDDALQYLDSLAQEAGDVPDLQRELAAAYERVGDVQGNPQFANLGDTAGSIASYRKALQIRNALARDEHATSDDQAALAAIDVKLGFGLRVINDFPAALGSFQQAYAIAEKLAAENKGDPQAQEAFGGVCFAMARCLADMGNAKSSLDYYRKSAAIREAITGGSPAFQANIQTRLAGVYGYMSGVVHSQGDLDSAISLQTKARDILAAQVRVDPQNATLMQFLLQGEYWVGYYLAEKGLPAQALPHFQTALAGYRKLTAADAHDVLAMRYLGMCYGSIGKALAAEGKASEGLESARKSLEIFEIQAAADHSDTFYKSTGVPNARATLAEIYLGLAEQRGASEASKVENWRKARDWYQMSLDAWLLLKQRAPLAKPDAMEPGKIAAKIAKCDAALAKLNAGGQQASQNPAHTGLK
jgi:non-specific serine/threonine protein kinase/serine/threonine-protein kinase